MALFTEDKLRQISDGEIDYKADIEHIISLLNLGEINLSLELYITEFINDTLIKVMKIIVNYWGLNNIRTIQEEKDNILNGWIMITKRINVMEKILYELPYEYTKYNYDNVKLIRKCRTEYDQSITNL